MIEPLLVFLACALDWAIGDPPRWPHFVRLVGFSIQRLERRLLPRAGRPAAALWAGAALSWCVVLGFGALAWLIMAGAAWLWPPLGWAVGLVLAFQCLAAGQLWREAGRVEAPLARGDLALARQRLSMIVGRETRNLDAAGIRRAVIETVAENFNDGVAAPLFYLALGGPALAVAYKAVNTLDSMVGYKNEKYGYFGRFAARLDDVAGFAPARLSAALIVAAARLCGLEAAGAWRAARDCHAAHASPNSGWPEAAAAGALELRMGGPNVYGGRLVEKPWINPHGRDPIAADVAAVRRLLATASLLGGLLAAGAAWLLPWGWF